MLLNNGILVGIYGSKKTIIAPPSCDLCQVLNLPLNTNTPSFSADISGYNRTVSLATNNFGVIGTPQIQSTFARPGATHSVFFNGVSNSGSLGMFEFLRDTWNNALSCFEIECWAYLPTGNLNLTTNNAAQPFNAICGSGGPNRGGMTLGVQNTSGADPRLRLVNALGSGFVESDIQFPLSTWVKVYVKHNRFTTETFLYMDDALRASSNSLTFPDIGNYGNFFIGGRDDNSSDRFNAAWRGYISDFKMWATSPQPCPSN